MPGTQAPQMVDANAGQVVDHPRRFEPEPLPREPLTLDTGSDEELERLIEMLQGLVAKREGEIAEAEQHLELLRPQLAVADDVRKKRMLRWSRGGA